MANLKGWLNTGWEKISCTIIGNKVAVDVVPCDLDGGVIGSSDAPSHMVIVDENGPVKYLPVKVSPSTDPTVSFANGDAANTQKTVTLTKPSIIKEYHRLVFHNPSTKTDLTVKVWNKASIGGVAKYFMGSFIVPAKATVTGTSIETDGRNLVKDLFMGNSDVELVISNNQVIGGSDGFTATVQVYAL